MLYSWVAEGEERARERDREKKERGGRRGEKDEERDKGEEGDTSGHEGERQIKFDRKLHEIVGEPRWSAPVLRPMPTRLFLATDYRRSGPRQEVHLLPTTSEGPVYWAPAQIPRLLTYRTPIMPQTYRALRSDESADDVTPRSVRAFVKGQPVGSHCEIHPADRSSLQSYKKGARRERLEEAFKKRRMYRS